MLRTEFLNNRWLQGICKVRMTSVLVFVLCGAFESAVEAHPGSYQLGDAWWLSWNFDLLVICNIFMLTAVYFHGIRKLWTRAGRRVVIMPWRFVSFVAGIFVLLLALVSPLDTISDDLSWVHMLQHMVLMVVAAPLIILGQPWIAFIHAVPLRLRRIVVMLTRWPVLIACSMSSFATNGFVIWGLHAFALWIWHLPSLYEWALRSQLVHDVEHLSFFVAACLFWRVALDSRQGSILDPFAKVLFLFTTSLHSTILGVLMTLSPVLWYESYRDRTEYWGLTALEDQQLAGAIMWMPACTVYAIAAAIQFAHWLGTMERESEPSSRACNRRNHSVGRVVSSANAT